MTRLGIVTGLAFEAALLEKAAASLQEYERPRIVCAGLGRERAERSAQELVAQGATALLSAGVAGGLDPALGPGTLILADSVVAAGGNAVATDTGWRVRLGTKFPVVTGAIAESPAPLGSAAEKAALRARTNAVAVDMESYGVARAAIHAGVPFLAVRAIADTSRDTLPRAALAGTAPDGTVRAAPVLREVLKRPADAPALIRLARANAAATRALRDFALVGLPFFGLV